MRRMWTTLRQALRVFPVGARKFFLWYAVLTGLLALLDVVALGVLALALAALVSGGADIPIMGALPPSGTVWLISAACVIFVLKSMSALLLHRLATRRFAGYELELGDRLFRAYAHAPWEERSRVSTAEITRIVDSSVSTATSGFAVPLMQVPGQLFTIVAVLAVLVVVQPLTAAIAIVYFALVFLIVMRVATRRVRAAGQVNRLLSFRVAVIMAEIVDALRELTLRGKLDEVGAEMRNQRETVTRARGTMAFLGATPKYAFEMALIGGIVLVGGGAYLAGGAELAVIAITMFAAAAFRLIPSIVALQSSLNQGQMNEAFARDVISGVDESEQWKTGTTAAVADTREMPIVRELLTLESVSYRYPGAERDVLEGIDLTIPIGSRFAIVGPSGAGKSTLIDVLLGLSKPAHGAVRLDGEDISGFLAAWRARVGFVPQRVALFDASIARNVALTWSDEFDRERVEWALERAQLTDILARPNGMDALIGERGGSLSGGQQQRLGIARALYSDPLVLVLDEATSSLDTATERQVLESLDSLTGEMTIVTVAHRLATIKDYDQICYLTDGRVVMSGTFDDLVERIPEFAVQVRLAGLR